MIQSTHLLMLMGEERITVPTISFSSPKSASDLCLTLFNSLPTQPLLAHQTYDAYFLPCAPIC